MVPIVAGLPRCAAMLARESEAWVRKWSGTWGTVPEPKVDEDSERGVDSQSGTLGDKAPIAEARGGTAATCS